ncbi:transposase [Viridibacillus arvi]|uniref:transposase n=1 Tax=Viridibacillus arvi TaxID=263475 RepID=UPI003CFCD035
MEHKNKGKKYNNEFKKTIVDLYYSGNLVRELNGEYGVSEVTNYKWVIECLVEESMTPKELDAIQKENQSSY